MFFIPTHCRVKKLKRFFASLGPEDLKFPFCILLWKDDPEFEQYMAEQWPCRITVLEGKYSYCTEKLNAAFWLYPNLPWYGFFGDDTVLVAKDTLHLLVERAERFNIAFPDEGKGWPGHVVLGGDLVRAMGFIAFPKLLHNCIDSVWLDIGTSFGLLKPCPEVECFLENSQHGKDDPRKCDMDEAYARVMTINQTGAWDFDRYWNRVERVPTFARIEEALHGKEK